MNNILFQTTAHINLLRGIQLIANAVGSTMGPLGKPAIINSEHLGTFITKDGATVSLHVSSNNPYEQMAIDLLREAALKTVSVVGDGTTTTILLASAIYERGILLIQNGISPIELTKQIESGLAVCIEYIKKSAKKPSSVNELIDVATIASNNDQEIGALIGTAIKNVKNTSLILVEESSSPISFSTVVPGLYFESGYASPLFITSNRKNESILNNLYILIYDGVIINANDIIPVLEKCYKDKKELLIIAEDVIESAFQTIVANHIQQTVKTCIVKIPNHEENTIQLLEDIAIFTGGKYLKKSSGISIELNGVPSLGKARKAIISKNKTIITGGLGNPEKIQQRIQALKKLLSSSPSNDIKARLAGLQGGIATIYVGGTTNPEIKEKRVRVEDAIDAVIAAQESGLVPGGGVIFLQCAELLKQAGKTRGLKLLSKALETPFLQIIKNANKNPKKIKKKLKKCKLQTCGYDILSDQVGDMFRLHVIDPAKVAITSLKNAVSISKLLLTAGTTIISPKTPQKPNYKIFLD